MKQPLVIQFWGDLICPLCPIGNVRLKKAIELFPHKDKVKLIYRSSRLRPGIAPHTVDSYLKQKYGKSADVNSILAQVEQMGADAGLTYKMAKTQAGDTLDAHRVVHFAKTQNMQMQAVERIQKAHFAEKQNIFDKDILMRLVGEIGLDKNEVASMLAGDKFKNEVEADEKAAKALGISGVPHFLINNQFHADDEHSPSQILAILNEAWIH